MRSKVAPTTQVAAMVRTHFDGILACTRSRQATASLKRSTGCSRPPNERRYRGEIVMMASTGVAHERINAALNIVVVRALQGDPDDRRRKSRCCLRIRYGLSPASPFSQHAFNAFSSSPRPGSRRDPGEACLVIEIAASGLAMTRAQSRALRVHRRERARHMGSHRRECRRMVVYYETRAAGNAHHVGAAWASRSGSATSHSNSWF